MLELRGPESKVEPENVSSLFTNGIKKTASNAKPWHLNGLMKMYVLAPSVETCIAYHVKPITPVNAPKNWG